MRILGIETSCDETGIALFETEQGLLADVLYSQIDMHAEYGGVVPELASRDHVRKAIPLIRDVFTKAGIEFGQVDGVAYTRGPGLAGALLVGSCLGRTLAWSWDVPAVGVHHMEGHLLAPMLEAEHPDFPFVALLVSGGHTQLVKVEGIGEYELLGESLDDAAGEAFDKTAKMMGLPYPGGPVLAKLANEGVADRFKFPRPMVDRPGLDFSFSGLKTATRTTIEQHIVDGKVDEQTQKDIARAFQDAVVDTLVIKCKRAIDQTGYKRLVIAGGVSANIHLRKKLEAMMQGKGGKVYYPAKEFCTDNGAMIAYAGAQRLLAKQHEGLSIEVKPRWPMTELEAI